MIDVRDHGTTGDGITDDAGALQSALDEAHGGGTVHIPRGTYRLSTALVVRSGTRIVAHDAYLFADGVHKILQNFHDTDVYPGYSGNSGITVHGGTWDAKGHLAPQGEIANVMGFIHARDITVQDVVIRNVAGYHGLEFNAVDGAHAINCRFEGYRQNGASFPREAIQVDIALPGSSDIGEFDGTYARNVVVDSCYAGPAADGSGLGPFGALVGSHTSRGSGYYDGVRVVDSRCEGSELYGIQAEAWRDAVITGNEISDTAGTAIYVHAGVGGVISGNTVRGPGSNGVNVTDQAGVRVAGNTVDTPTGDSGSYCVYLNHATDCRVEDNELRGGPTAGLKFAVGTDDAVVRANTFRRDGGSPTAVICDAGDGTTNTVTDNDVTDYGDGPDVIDIRSGTIRTDSGRDRAAGREAPVDPTGSGEATR